MDGGRHYIGASGCGNDPVVLHMEALKGVMKMNLLIENYDDECGLDYYYIQNNEIKEFGDEIFKKLNKISIVVLTGGLFFGSESEIKKERGKAISKLADCLKNAGYSLEKIFIMSNGMLTKSYTVEREEE